MLEFMEGFDGLANAADLAECGWTDGYSNATISTSGRNGGRALSGGTVNLNIGFPAITTERIVGFAYYAEAFPDAYGLNPEILRFTDNGLNQFALLGNSSGGLIVSVAGGFNRTRLADGGVSRGVSDSGIMSLYGWNYIEIKFTVGNAGSAYVYLNGDPTPVISAVGVDIDYTGSGSWNTMQLCLPGGAAMIDDVYMLSTTGGTLTSRLGDVSVRLHTPNGDGVSSQWTRSTGANQYATIDDVPPDETVDDYNQSAVVNDLDLVDVQNLVATGYNILGVQSVAHAKKTDTGTGGIKLMVRSGGTNYTDTTENFLPFGAYQFLRGDVYEVNPNTSVAWTETNFNSAQFGYKKST